jgi:outer membrane protein, multidrug efflux system
VESLTKASELVEILYTTGLSDFQNVLDTQRFLFQQQDALAVSEGQVARNAIALYKALGGGWAESDVIAGL